MSVQSSESLEQKKRGKRGYFKYSLFHIWLFPGKHFLHLNTVCYFVNLFYESIWITEDI